MTNTMTTVDVPEGTETPRRSGRAVRYGKAVPFFVVPFGLLFLLFYVLPIGYAIVQSLYTVERSGTFGPAREVFGGLVQYQRVFENGPFWSSIGRRAARNEVWLLRRPATHALAPSSRNARSIGSTLFICW